MSWICKNCSHCNLDEDEICIVCDTPRAEEHDLSGALDHTEKTESRVSGGSDRAREFSEIFRDTLERMSERTRLGHSRSERVRILNKLFSILLILCSFIVGQIVEYITLAKSEYVLILTDFIKATADYGFNTLAFLISTTIFGAIATGLYIYLVCYFNARRKLINNWLISGAFAIIMSINPAIGSFFAIFFAVLLLVIRTKRGAKAVAALFSAVATAALIIMLSVAKSVPPIYMITLDFQGGTGSAEQIYIKIDEEMPNMEVPSRKGYTFLGFYDEQIGGEQYYDADMIGTRTWDIGENITLYAHWTANTYTITFNKQEGVGGTDSVLATYDSSVPSAQAPVRTGYTFGGYYDSISGGMQYYDSAMQSMQRWDKADDTTLYAHWNANSYEVTLDSQGGSGGDDSIIATYGQNMPSATKPTRAGRDFNGYYTGVNGTGICYYNSSMSSVRTWDIAHDTTLYAYWTVSKISASASPSSLSGIDSSKTATIRVTGGSGNYSYKVTNNPPGVSYSFSGNVLTLQKTSDNASGTVSIMVTDTDTKATTTCSVSYSTTGSCIITGTLITLSDGSQVPVETLKGNELLLVWNLYTGDFDVAPILFIDKDEYKEYEIIHLFFSDGTEVKVITEHAFWDFTLNEYVFLRSDASKYIGHWFNKQICIGEDLSWTKVQLIEVSIEREYSIAWSPVTYGHLCYYVNGMLSMPGNTEGLINIFNVDSDHMAYDAESMLEDIERYGLFTYEEFDNILHVSEEFFEAFNGQYLKIALGKGLIDWARIASLISRYDIEVFRATKMAGQQG